MGFLIDTNLWIAVERGGLSAAGIQAITRQAPVFLSPVNLAEIRFGIDLMNDKKHRLRAMTMLRRLRRKPLLRITGETAEIFGATAAELTRPDAVPTFASKTCGSPRRPFNANVRCSRQTPKTLKTFPT